jgi:hypothetical protein
MEDLSGKLIIKVALGDDIRRIPIHNEVPSLINSNFPGPCTQSDKIGQNFAIWALFGYFCPFFHFHLNKLFLRMIC